jgi:hypothetical protein
VTSISATCERPEQDDAAAVASLHALRADADFPRTLGNDTISRRAVPSMRDPCALQKHEGRKSCSETGYEASSPRPL